MSDAYALPADVRQFVRAHIVTPTHLDVLMALHGLRGGPLTLAELVAQTHAQPAPVRSAVADLEQAGVLERTGDEVRYAPVSADISTLVARTADAYERIPVQLIRAVYERPSSTASLFADAFRIKREK